MKRLMSLVAVVIIAVAGVSVVMAQDNGGTIENTGPGSDNQIVFDTKEECEVENNINVDVNNDTDQDADTGDANTDGNNEGEGAETGDAGNSNSTNIGFTVNNEGDECVETEKETPETPETPSTPESPDNGGGGVTLGDSDEGTVDYEELPPTNSTTITAAVAAATAVLIGVTIAARVGGDKVLAFFKG